MLNSPTCVKKHTINFSTCAQFHCQIQKKKNEFCHYDIYTWRMNQVSSLHQLVKWKSAEVYVQKKHNINFSTCAQFHCQIQKKKYEFCHYDIHEGWTKWAHYSKILLKKQWKCICLKKHTISFATCAPFHWQIQKKKNEFCHHDIHEGWTKRGHCIKILLNKTVHVYMYKKTYHKLLYMCSVSLPNPKKKLKIKMSCH